MQNAGTADSRNQIDNSPEQSIIGQQVPSDNTGRVIERHTLFACTGHPLILRYRAVFFFNTSTILISLIAYVSYEIRVRTTSLIGTGHSAYPGVNVCVLRVQGDRRIFASNENVQRPNGIPAVLNCHFNRIYSMSKTPSKTACRHVVCA